MHSDANYILRGFYFKSYALWVIISSFPKDAIKMRIDIILPVYAKLWNKAVGILLISLKSKSTGVILVREAIQHL